eukprot:5475457-Lingulodinium_polyedra.AAC.1
MSYQTARARTHNVHKVRSLVREQKPARCITYCTWGHWRDYRPMMQMSMYQAAEKRLFYLWASCNPWGLDDSEIDPLIKHVLTQFNMYYRRSSKDLGSCKFTDLYLITAD